jgi:hypothetical protein
MPDLIRHPVLFWIAQKLHCVSRLRGNDSIRVFSHRSNMSNVDYHYATTHLERGKLIHFVGILKV